MKIKTKLAKKSGAFRRTVMFYQLQEEFVNMAYLSKRDFAYLSLYSLLDRSRTINISDTITKAIINENIYIFNDKG